LHALLGRTVSGFAVLAALLVVQQQGGTADTLKARDYITVGGAVIAGEFVVATYTPPRITTRRQHDYHVVGATAGWRRETVNWSLGVRGKLFTGTDNASKRDVTSGFRQPGPVDVPFATPLHGWAGMLDLDQAYVGVSGGYIAGTLMKEKTDQPEGLRVRTGVVSVRAGLLSRFYGELAVHDHDPVPAPGSDTKVSAVFVDDSGNRYRIGFTDAGPFGEFSVLARGFEVTPFFSGGDNEGFNFSIRIARRFAVR
jgi:hypothetical protein